MANIILYFHGGSKNHGCEALSRTVVKIANADKARLLSIRPEEDYKYHFDEICEIECFERPIKSRILHKILRFASMIRRDLKVYCLYKYKGLNKKIQKADVAISIGGDNYCYGRTYEYLNYVNDIFQKEGVKLILWGCSIEPELLKIDTIVRDLKRHSIIIARESITYNALIQAGIDKNTKLLPDPAFTLEAINHELPLGFIENQTIGINISPLIQKLENEENITFENYKCLIQYIIEKTEYHIALIPHVIWESSNDLKPLQELYQLFKETNRVVLLDDANCMVLKGFISRCKLFIGARTHATIAAYSTGVPTLVVGYSVKAKGIAQDIFGTYENYVVSVQSLKKANDLTNAFIWLEEHADEIKTHLESFMPSYIEKAYLARESIKQLIGETH